MRTQFEAAIRGSRTGQSLDDVARLLWRATAEGEITEDEAAALGEAIESQRSKFQQSYPLKQERHLRALIRRSPSRDRQRSLERRRRLAASGPLPPAIAALFTVAELAALRIIGDEIRERGCCTCSIGEIAARAGVGRTSVQNAIRRAAGQGLLNVQERRLRMFRNDTNVISICSKEWAAWLGLRPQGRVQKNEPHGYKFIYKSGNLCERRGGEVGKSFEKSKYQPLGNSIIPLLKNFRPR